MSLQLAAQHLASKGRGPDTTLVHMAPGEVRSLQALARAHGGSLTTNPDTGLPEAGFLSAILPIIAGAALGPAGMGLTAMQAGLAAGALGTVATGSLRKGLLAGLGAYGGAGLMGSVAGAGNAAASGMAAGEAAGAGAAEAAAQMTPAAGVVPAAPVTAPVAPAVVTAAEYAAFQPTTASFGAMGEAPLSVAATPPASAFPPPVMNSPAIDPATLGTARTVPYEQMRAAGLSDEAIRQSATEYGANVAGTSRGTPFSAATRQAMASPISSGIKAIAQKPELLFNKGNLYYGAAAAAPLMFQEPKSVTPPPGGPNPYQYDYSANPTGATPGASSSETRFFDPRYTRRMAEGGSTDYDPRIGMSGESARAYRYLMGIPDAPVVATPASGISAGLAALPGTNAGMSYVYDPVSQSYREVATSSLPAPAPSVETNYDAGAGPATSSNPGWDSLTPAEQASFYAANPTFSAITQAGQALFGLTTIGALQNAINPGFVTEQSLIAQGIDPTGTNPSGIDAQNGMDVGAHPAMGFGSAIGDPSGIAGLSTGFTDSGTIGGNADAGGSAPSGPAGDASGIAGLSTGFSDSGTVGGNADSGGGGDGGAAGGPGGSCFLTTAAVEHMGEDDDGEVLNTLRRFRDTYMRKNKEKSKDVAWYYENAPKIVAALDENPNADRLYKTMYRKYIEPAYEAIKDGDNEAAYRIYKQGIDYAKRVSGIEADELSPRYGRNGMARGGLSALAGGGQSHLGDYSDGGRLLRGPGDGVSDSIPAVIANKQPARLADGEFVVPARIVSELGNGSTEAGARKLYAMMNRIQKDRRKSIGKGKVAVNSRADKHLPA